MIVMSNIVIYLSREKKTKQFDVAEKKQKAGSFSRIFRIWPAGFERFLRLTDHRRYNTGLHVFKNHKWVLDVFTMFGIKFSII